MKFKSIKILPENTLVYEMGELVDNQNRLTKKGAENFLGILSTLLLNYTHEKKPKWLLDRFPLILQNRFSLSSSFRIYMMSLINHKLNEDQKNILIDGLAKAPFDKKLLLDESLHTWLEENIIDEISFYRNLELGKLLIKDASRFLSFTSIINMKSSKDILSEAPYDSFEQKIIEILQQKIPMEKPSDVAMKVFLFNCLKYSYDSKNFPEVLILKFALDVKQNFFFYEKSFSKMRDHYKDVIQKLYNEHKKGKNNSKGLNR